MSNCDDMTHFVAVIGRLAELVYCTCLENKRSITGTKSSNLLPSAKLHNYGTNLL